MLNNIVSLTNTQNEVLYNSNALKPSLLPHQIKFHQIYQKINTQIIHRNRHRSEITHPQQIKKKTKVKRKLNVINGKRHSQQNTL